MMSLFHINWADGDDIFILADSKEEAIEKASVEPGMVRYVVQLDSLYQLIKREGMKQVVEWVDQKLIYCPIEVKGMAITGEEQFGMHLQTNPEKSFEKWTKFKKGLKL